MRQLSLLIAFGLLGYCLPAQIDILQDSVAFIHKDSVIAATKAPKEFKGPLSMFVGKPGRAALYSLILPGAGQAFNKKYWKIPFVLAAEGTAIGFLVYNINEYKKWDQALNDIYSVPTIPNPNTTGRTPNEVLNIRNRSEKRRDYSIISVVLIHFIQVADAFVNRHLIEFDVSDDLSLQLGSSGPIPSLSLTATF